MSDPTRAADKENLETKLSRIEAEVEKYQGELENKNETYNRSARVQVRTIWDYLALSGLFGAIWHYLGLLGIISDYLGLSGTISDNFGHFRTISDYLGLYRTLSDFLGISETIWDYLGLSETIRDYLV